MFASLIASAMFQLKVSQMNHILELRNFKATSFGDYIEVYNNEVSYDPTTDTSWVIMVRYFQEGSGKDMARPFLDQVRHLSGKRTVQDFLDDQEVLPGITKLR